MLRRHVQLQYCEYKHMQQEKVHDEKKKNVVLHLCEGNLQVAQY